MMKNLSAYLMVLCLAALPLSAAAAPAANTAPAAQQAAGAAKPNKPSVANTPAELTPDTEDAYQSPYPPYLGGDKAYPLIETRRGTAWYLDIGSIYAELYNPPEYILTAYLIKLDDADKGNTIPGRMIPLRIRYNTQTMTMYYDREPGKNQWAAVVPFDGWLRTGVVLPAGEAAYYLFYEEKFYGRRKYNITLRGKVVDNDYPFPASFYELLQGQASPSAPPPSTSGLPRR